MVKVKNKQNFGLAEKVHVKKHQEKFKKKLNPFEVHVNRQKFTIIGKKNKNDKGLPGVSRGKAVKKRQNTLGHELKLINKSNTFLDKRIGEKNSAISEEEKMIARFTAEKLQQHKVKTNKKSIYNLAEDEILTHRGQTLEEIEKFDDPRSDDEEDDEFMKRSGGLQGSFVSDANFGGGVLSRSENTDGAKSRKDLIEQLILESKKRKLEKQKMKEETLDLTQRLDTEWKDLHVIVSKEFNKETETTTEKPSVIDKLLNEHNKKNEEYDKTMRELKFEPRGTPSDRLKSEDEIAKIEKQKLEKLEDERLARMKGTFEIKSATQKPKHKSADDLDDGFELEDVSDFMIAYDKEGKLITPLENNAEATNENDDSESEDNSDDNENDDEEGEEEEEEDESANDSDDSLNDLREADTHSSDEDEPSSNKKSKSNQGKINTNTTNISTKTLKRKLDNESEDLVENKTVSNTNVTKNNNDTSEKIKQDLLSRKIMMEKASKELPYTYKMPENYEDLSELLQSQPPDYQNIIIERIIKCNHPSLSEGNKEKLGHLFAYLLQHINDLFSSENITNEKELSDAFKCLDSIVCHLYTIAIMDPTNAKTCIMEVVKEKYEDFKRNSKRYPGMDTIIFFKLVSVLFPTSDLRHPIVTPCTLFMTNILTSCRIRNSIDISKGLFIVTLMLEYTSLSKRIVPAAINFVRGILSLCIPMNLKKQISVLPPFKTMGNFCDLLVLRENCSKKKISSITKMSLEYLIESNDHDNFKICILISTLKMFETLFNQSKELHCQNVLFEDHIRIIKILASQKYPMDVLNLIKTTLSNVSKTLEFKSITPLVEEKLPKMIKTYEPAFDTNFTGKKRRVMSKEKAEHQKLLYKHKKEMKSALREIRRDKSFIGSVKIKQKLKSDEMRKQKVKQIYAEASLQQGELNALQRSKKKKK